jgi:cobalt-zinc-cadmium efflux system membrane fusion protein
MNVANPDRRIKPSMLATLTIHGHPQQELVAPEKALVREGEQEYVFVERAPGRFLLTPVRTGQAWRGQKVIVDGLRENDTIVSEGAFHLNNERRRRSLRGSE